MSANTGDTLSFMQSSCMSGRDNPHHGARSIESHATLSYGWLSARSSIERSRTTTRSESGSKASALNNMPSALRRAIVSSRCRLDLQRTATDSDLSIDFITETTRSASAPSFLPS